ncbi:MAG TPA: hypothetical protein VFH31_14215 [Pyrinomonadaceae bacterium]|nr:hypothetical protein [Pyrinomonadaceae bacterium]
MRAISTAIKLAFLVALVASCSSALAQTRTPNPTIGADKSSNSDDSQSPTNPMAEEMRVKREIRYAEREHQQNLDRAQELSELGKGLALSFKKKQSLDRDDWKKLERLEKLANKIRNEAGGSDDEQPVEKKPNSLAEAIDCIAKVSASLNQKVQQTPRRVVSTATIDKANVLLELIRIARGFVRNSS